MGKEPEILSLDERVARLEGRLGWRRTDYVLGRRESIASALLLLLAILVSLRGLGLPNHWYQVVLAILISALCYHREWLIPPASKLLMVVLAVANTALIAIMLKLVIGSGKRFPFFWAMYPRIEQQPEAAGQRWVEVVPKLQLIWEQSGLAAWGIDLTVIQTFLLMLTLFGALFDFQPFISFTAFLLILVSIPALVGFSWGWVFPSLVLLAIVLYLQSASYQEDF